MRRSVYDIDRVGAVLNADGGPGIGALAFGFRRSRDSSTNPAQPATGDSNGNGMIERGVQEWAGMLRTQRLDLERRIGQAIDQSWSAWDLNQTFKTNTCPKLRGPADLGFWLQGQVHTSPYQPIGPPKDAGDSGGTSPVADGA